MKHPISAQRLQEALRDTNLKPVDLSERSGVSQSSISQYMCGSHAPSNISSKKMAEVLHCSPVWLMGFDVPKHADQEKAATGIWDGLLKDRNLMDALSVYIKMSPEKKKHVVDMIKLLGAE